MICCWLFSRYSHFFCIRYIRNGIDGYRLQVTRRAFSWPCLQRKLHWCCRCFVWRIRGCVRNRFVPNAGSYSFPDMIGNVFVQLPGVLVYIGKIVFPFQLSVYPDLAQSSLVPGIVALVLLAIALLKGLTFPGKVRPFLIVFFTETSGDFCPCSILFQTEQGIIHAAYHQCQRSGVMRYLREAGIDIHLCPVSRSDGDMYDRYGKRRRRRGQIHESHGYPSISAGQEKRCYFPCEDVNIGFWECLRLCTCFPTANWFCLDGCTRGMNNSRATLPAKRHTGYFPERVEHEETAVDKQ